MRRRVGIGFGLAVIAAAFLLWRSHRDTTGNPDTGAAQGDTWRATGRATRGHAPDPRAPAGASLAGTVTDATTRAPVARAQVCADGRSTELADERLREPICTDSAADGRYLISNLPPASYFVHASARSYRPELHHPDGDRQKRSVVLAAAERRSGVDIALRPGGVEITGTVADLTGGPIAHARVRSGGRLSGQPGGAAETDDRGRFSLWVSPGPIGVTASADGYAPQTTSGSAPGTFELLLAPEASFAGTVVDGATGQPVAGARVSLSGDGPGIESGATITGPDGAYHVGGLGPGRYIATARTEHGWGRTDGSLLVGLGQQVDGVVVKLSRAMRVEGKLVIAATGQPCPDGSVKLRDTARRLTLALRETPGGIHVAEGALPGTYSVEPACRDFVSRESYPPVTLADKDVTGLAWEVDAGATLRGKVTTRSGEPVEGALVSAHPATGDHLADWRSTWSGDDGRYELRGIRPGAHRLDVSSQRAPAPAGGFAIEIASAAVVERDLVLDDGGTIKGAVVDPDGKPVGGIYIAARLANGRPSFRPGECKSDDAGAFTCDAIPTGDYRVTAQTTRFARPRLSGDDNAGAAVTVRASQVSTVKLVVEAQSGAIRGTVVDGDGRPVDDAFVSAVRESEGPGPGFAMLEIRWSWGVRPNLTAADGSFTVPRLAPGSYMLRAYRKGGGEAIAEHAAVGSTVKLQITTPGSIEGTARRAGVPLAGITVSVHNPQTWLSREEQFYETAGHFVVRDLPKGHLQITVETEGARKQLELDLADSEHKTVDVELDDLVTLTGRVVEKATTTPIAGVRMMAHLAGGRSQPPGLDDSSVSDAGGRFTIRNVSRGKLVVVGFSSSASEASRGFVHVERTVDGTGTIDIGDVELARRGN
jgi:protocatechuate 3,4-dioxygenase beta subunit